MKKVLYLTNIEVPYKVRFFNELSKQCDLTVLYERKISRNRNSAWAGSEKKDYQIEYLEGLKVGNEFAFSLRIIRYILGNYDAVIISCFNSPIQLFATLIMRIFRKPYILSLDGEIFISGNRIKTKLKKFFLSGAEKYLIAGESSADSLRKVIGRKEVVPYYFSSLSAEELKEHEIRAKNVVREKFVLVIGQYLDYKGMDIAIQSAIMDSSITYRFVGMGKRTELFVKEQRLSQVVNVEVIPFMQKEDLEKEYMKASVLVLPSRQECWGLVINEAASFGTPIVSTIGSGAAVEFLREGYEKYLAKVEDAEDLYDKIKMVIGSDNTDYSYFLLEKGKQYNIQRMVEAHCRTLEL